MPLLVRIPNCNLSTQPERSTLIRPDQAEAWDDGDNGLGTEVTKEVTTMGKRHTIKLANKAMRRGQQKVLLGAFAEKYSKDLQEIGWVLDSISPIGHRPTFRRAGPLD